MRAHLRSGVVCPCCDKNAKVYTRKLTYLLTVPLILGWRASGIGEWLSFSDVLAPLVADENVGRWFEPIQRRGEWKRLPVWELALPNIKEGDGVREFGYVITELGERFIKGEVKVPSHYYEYKGKFAGWMWLGDEEIKYLTVVDTLGTKFNWKDLMP